MLTTTFLTARIYSSFVWYKSVVLFNKVFDTISSAFSSHSGGSNIPVTAFQDTMNSTPNKEVSQPPPPPHYHFPTNPWKTLWITVNSFRRVLRVINHIFCSASERLLRSFLPRVLSRRNRPWRRYFHKKYLSIVYYITIMIINILHWRHEYFIEDGRDGCRKTSNILLLKSKLKLQDLHSQIEYVTK